MADVDELILRALEVTEQGDPNTALELWTEILALDPGNARAYFERGMSHLSVNDVESAIDDFGVCLAADPRFPGARDWLGRAFELNGDNERAAQEFELALRSDLIEQNAYISPQQWADCANAYENAGDTHNALRILKEYFAKYVQRVNIHRDLETAPMRQYANLLLGTREAAEALRYASLAYRSRHRKPMDVLVYARAAECSGDMSLARRLCNEALKLNEHMPGIQELYDRLNH